jgi:uncharacterized membrane protein YhaH (DUF805 family)
MMSIPGAEGRALVHPASRRYTSRDRSLQQLSCASVQKDKEYVMRWYMEVLRQYAVFRGRSARTEYWMFILINLIITVILDLFDSALLGDMVYASGPLTSIYMLAVLLPNLAVAVRRLHDTGRSGWYLLLLFIPFIGLLLFLILMAQDSHPGDNRYGADPKHRTAG